MTGNPKLPLHPFPYPLIYALAPFNETFRELLEMRYLWRRPIGLDNTRLVRFLGAEPHTPLDRAMTATLADMDCLGAEAQPKNLAATLPHPLHAGHVRPNPL